MYSRNIFANIRVFFEYDKSLSHYYDLHIVFFPPEDKRG